MSIYLLRQKSATAAAFIAFEKKMFNMTGKHISVLRSDGGKEYFNHLVSNYCSEFGITHQSSTPYTPQQNGRAERPNRSVLEGISALLHDSQLTWSFWGYAAQIYRNSAGISVRRIIFFANFSPNTLIPVVNF